MLYFNFNMKSIFQASKVPRLPAIHSVSRQDSEIVLNPATLERSGDWNTLQNTN